ncbi:hypothetical protein D4764_19G0000960 [Takifugu flavidus]|uniref:Alkylated DNA repair protein AlkB homologue 8 N-terminal domain-containing protein n=1 Tax=Takifugu flavidus TaxID=433684 RepID=A0A5C6NNK5_9TELE|nr:hypothetical protein D4764_19G0000960 [Takifugu flavidus]
MAWKFTKTQVTAGSGQALNQPDPTSSQYRCPNIQETKFGDCAVTKQRRIIYFSSGETLEEKDSEEEEDQPSDSPFRETSVLIQEAVNILGTDVDAVESYKYLGVHLNNNLDWTHNTDALVKKGNSRLFLLRRLRSFGVQGPLLRTFYDSVVGSAIFYG